MPNNQSSQNPQSVPLGTDPCEGRKAIKVLIDFSLGAQYTLDLSQIQAQGAFASLQTLYIDNTANGQPLKIETGVVLQDITIPAGAQAYIPVLESNPPRLLFSTTGGNVIVSVHLLNFFVPPYIWNGAALQVVDLTLESVIANGRVLVTTNASTISGATDGSGTIAAGGTSQALFAANATRKKWLISNPSTATEVLSFSFISGAGGQITLPPGTTYTEDSIEVAGDAVFVKAATTGHAFTAYSWG